MPGALRQGGGSVTEPPALRGGFFADMGIPASDTEEGAAKFFNGIFDGIFKNRNFEMAQPCGLRRFVGLCPSPEAQIK
jgi:hypothetical protein